AGFLLRIPSANELTGIRKERRPKDWAEFVLASSEQPEMKNDTRTHILVVDDEVSVLNLVRNYLETNGFRVSTAVTADEGVVKAGTLLPNLVLLDLGLPGSNGYEVTQQIRRKHSFSHMPIIIMTVRETMEEALQGLEFGANDFILKPISVQNLVARVKICLKISDINGSYERFVPPELVKLLKKQNITDVFLGDHVEREITILFSDIRSFTKISEEMTPGETFSFLNEYLERVGPVIKRNRGFIDKYIGDAIMAIFPFSADDAVRAAIQMQKEIYQLNAELFAAGKKTIRVGIGIHTGDVILGTIGEEERMEGTVISDAVNLTSRLENLTKLYGTNILISMDTFLNLDVPEEYNFRILDRVKVKGKNKLVTVIEIFDGLEPERMGMAVSTKTLFEEAVAHYLSRDFQTAIDGFMQILDVNPKDNAAMIYVQRAEYYMNSVLPENPIQSR
ncbi:MAG TPA: adenylate/guanylate cyclase domain-containing protein, partial [Leptospiraceae bacterium]|nr:adenylate/guanylate cyclase domain-containing protein [Leptospiraceae bacterium]